MLNHMSYTQVEESLLFENILTVISITHNFVEMDSYMLE